MPAMSQAGNAQPIRKLARACMPCVDVRLQPQLREAINAWQALTAFELAEMPPPRRRSQDAREHTLKLDTK